MHHRWILALLLPLLVPGRAAARQQQQQPDTTRQSALAQIANLSMRITGLGELGSSWTRYSPCDPSLFVNCNPSLFPQLRPNAEFGVQVNGTISDRIHIDVDYDQRREDFQAAQRINVFYQGLEGELLQRVEVGDVSLRFPASRYLTSTVPAGNFGVMARANSGPFELQAVFAQQKGDLSTREFRLAAGGAVDGLVQDEELVLDDADYVKGQFFFLFDPALLGGVPHVDVLALRAGDAPASVRPRQGGNLQLFRDERLTAATNQQAQLGIFLADAVSEDTSQRHTGLFRRLVPGEDYYVHVSGLWIVLRSPLRQDEALAIAYETESGDTIGDVNAERAPPGTTPELRLLRSPAATHQPGQPTWDLEMHHVYRINSASGVELASLDVRISLGDVSGGRTFRTTPTGTISFLRLFGLDDDAPADAVDIVNVFQPARDAFGGAGRVGGTYLVFPTLEPFATPPPVPIEGLSADDALALLGGDANPAIYEEADPIAREDAGRFRLNFRYRVRTEGLVSTFSLGQFGIRENTERLVVDGRALVRDVDYAIDYELGIVTLTDAPSLFATNPAAEIRATWEQRSLFQVAPTSILGTSASWQLGSKGAFHLMGVYQTERSLYTRPQLGVEPASIFLGGASADMRFAAPWLDRAFASVPFLRADTGSAFTLTGELALSLPDPNRNDAAYLDDFEGADEVSLDVRRQQWRLGARPGTNAGDDGVLPIMDVNTATPLVWQHDIAEGGAIRGNLFPRRDIDNQINIAGNEVPEPVMWLTFGEPGPAAGDRRWRSMTTVLSQTGRDMSRSEFIELYVRATDREPLALVLDIGTVGEDAFHFDEQGRTNGTYDDGEPWGLGILDEEASLAEREVWGPAADARGLWDQDCTAEPLKAYALGDARSNCTRGNGVPDTEDLDGNGILNPDDGAYFRYVVTLDQLSRYLVRDTVATGTGFRLYRIPLGGGTPVNGASEATWRFIRHLRITVAGEPAGTEELVLARMRIIGSRWTKRGVTGVLDGIFGDLPGLGAASTEVRVGPVSRLTDGTDYSSPPGVLDELQDPTSQFAGGVEFNEKSLRIAYDGLLPRERAEVYVRYPQQPRDFLTYRSLRIWALPRAGNWGETGDQRLLVKIGTDPANHYLYQTKLHTATGSRPATQADWQPEIVVDFDRWIDLKAEAEERSILRGGIGRDTVWSADSMYAVVQEDRARAPNLSAVREIVLAVYNSGDALADGEVWIDELRLAAPLRDAGMAGGISMQLTGGFLSGGITYANRGPLFRQLNEGPAYRSTGDVSVNATLRLDRMMPESWGVTLPLTVTHVRTAQDPTFLERSDVRADRLSGLRPTESSVTRVGVRIARSAGSDNAWLRLLVDPATFRFGFSRAQTSTITTRNESSGVDGGIDYLYRVESRDFAAVPGFLGSVLRALAPASIENSEAFDRLVNARLRWTPEIVGFGTSWYDRENDAYRFDRILESAVDSAVRPVQSPRQGLENNVEVRLLPFTPLSAGVGLRSSRDLLDPGRATNQPFQRSALERARGRIAGTDVGWETNRTFTTNLSFRPRITDWLQPAFSYSNRYGMDRNPSYLDLLLEGEDTAAVLQRRFGSDRQVQRRIAFQPGALIEAMVGVEPDSVAGFGGLLYRAARAWQGIRVDWNGGLNSQFERAGFEPGMGYRLGLGRAESFRFIEGDTAAQTLERQDVRINSTLALPLEGLLTIDYANIETDGFDVRGGRRSNVQRTWPGVRLSWTAIPVPAALAGVFAGASASAGYERVRRTTAYGDAQLRTGIDDRYPISIGLTFAGGISANYSGTLSHGDASDPTGDAEQDRDNHSLRVSGSIQPPGFMRERIRQPIQTSLVFSEDRQHQCRVRPGLSGELDCVPYIDSRTRTLNLTVDTRLSDLLVGFRLGYTGRRNYVGTRAGSSQFQLALFGQFEFTAAELFPAR